MGEQPEVPSSDLFTGVDTAEDRDISGEGVEVTPEDRPRGILSPTDREYLCGLKEYAQPQTDANRRQDIRERIRNGLKDFMLLWLFLERNEREKVFEELGEEGTDEVIESMISFAYLGIDHDRPRMQGRSQLGILAAENRDKLFRSVGRATDVDVSIDIEYNPDPEKLYQRFENDGELSDAEVGVLVRAGKLDSDDIAKLQDWKTDFPGVSVGGDADL